MSIYIVGEPFNDTSHMQSLLTKHGFMDVKSYTVTDLEKTSARTRFMRVSILVIYHNPPLFDGISWYKQLLQNDDIKEVLTLIIFNGDRNEEERILEINELGSVDYILDSTNELKLLARIRFMLNIKNKINQISRQNKKVNDDFRLARAVQQSVLTPSINEEKIQIAATYIPSEMLGGDMYSWFKVDESRYALILMDVMGHGIASSLVGMSIRSLLRGMIHRLVDPIAVMDELNKHVYELFQTDEEITYYLTCIYLVVDVEKRTVEFVNAGHPSGFMFEGNDNVQILRQSAPFVGIFSKLPMEKRTITFKEQVRIVLYTDGLSDALNMSIEKNGNYLFKPYINDSNHQFLDKIKTDYDLLNKDYDDDICLIAITIRE